MYLIDEVLVSEDLFSEQFTCNLNACQGACCWEGDWGAPLEEDEIKILSSIREDLRPYLSELSNLTIDNHGISTYYQEPEMNGTPLMDNGACVYMTTDENGVAQCGIEQAHADGKISWLKPISCHLYPVRYSEVESTSFRALNYERWDICSAACQLGKKLKMPVFKFVKNALIRKFGEAFYTELEAVHRDNQED